MESIKNLIDGLIDCKSGKDLCEKCYNDDLYIANSYFKDHVEEAKIIALIRSSLHNYKLQTVLLEIIFYIDEKSFTDNIIENCINYPGKFKDTLLIQLAHVWLSEKQLEKINEVVKIPEAYCKLLYIKVCNEKISEDELTKFIQTNKCYFEDLKDYIAYFKKANVNPERIRLVDKLLSIK